MSVNLPGLCMGCMSPLTEEQVICPRCGCDNSAPYDKQYRKPGSIVGGRYILGRLTHKNGEGAVYVGYDNSVQAKVWVREYFPSTIALRDPLSGDVLPLAGCDAQFKALLSDFGDVCNDVRRMGVTEPVIPIENVVVDAGTAYAVYKDVGAVSFEEWLGRQGGKLTVAEAREVLQPVFNTLSNIHSRGVIHRGISPKTIYVDADEKIYLWDFCMSATRTGGSELEAELFDGYSAPEQYISNGWQGTWTDVYGAAALFYRTVSGFVPPKATQINEQRPLAPLMDLVMDIPQNISDAVDEAMRQNTSDRTQDIGTFVSRLMQSDLDTTAVYDTNKINEVKLKRERKRVEREESRRRGKYVVLGLIITFLVLCGGMFWFANRYLDMGQDSESSSSAADSGSSQSEEESSDPEETQNTEMPYLVGEKLEDVQREYGGRYIIEVEEDYHEVLEEGVIYKQTPEVGTKILDGRTIILYVSKGKRQIEMPELIGKTREEVVEIIADIAKDVGYDIPYTDYERYQADADPGTVVGTSPPAGEVFDPKSKPINVFFMPESDEEESQEESASGSGDSRSSSQGDRSIVTERVPPEEDSGARADRDSASGRYE